MEAKTWTIYALLDPVPLADAGDVRYVGWTVKTAWNRLRTHCGAARSKKSQDYNSWKSRWLRSLLAAGLMPVPIVLETGTDMDLWKDAEKKWIAHYRALGARLTNATDGGDGTPGHVQSPETRAKIAERSKVSQRGRKHSPETRAKMSASATARQSTPEARAAMSKARSAATLTPAGRAKLVECGKRLKGARARMGIGKLTADQVRDIRARVAAGEKRRAVADAFGVHNSTITGILRGKIWLEVPGTIGPDARAKLNPDKVREIRALVRAGEEKQAVAARFGVSGSLVGAIMAGRIWAKVHDAPPVVEPSAAPAGSPSC